MNKGSYTVEAAMIVPFLLFLFVTVVSMAIALYQEIRDGDPEYFQEDMWAVETFYKWETAGGLLDGEK